MRLGIKKLAILLALGLTAAAPSSFAWGHYNHWHYNHYHHWHRGGGNLAAGLVAGAALGIFAGAMITAANQPQERTVVVTHYAPPPPVVVHKYCHIRGGYEYCKTVTTSYN